MLASWDLASWHRRIALFSWICVSLGALSITGKTAHPVFGHVHLDQSLSSALFDACLAFCVIVPAFGSSWLTASRAKRLTSFLPNTSPDAHFGPCGFVRLFGRLIAPVPQSEHPSIAKRQPQRDHMQDLAPSTTDSETDHVRFWVFRASGFSVFVPTNGNK